MNLGDSHHPDYQSYLLRLWREGAQRPWRGSLQSTATEQVYHFANLEALFAFLAVRLAEGEDTAASNEPRPP